VAQGKKGTAAKKTSITLPPVVDKALDELCEATQLKKSAIITSAILKYHREWEKEKILN
jgi:predicted transcriptional regulator